MSADAPGNNTGLAVMTTVRNYGIDTVFGIPGTHNLEFYRHLLPLGIRPVTTRHEQGAGYGADGWSQLSGLPGVVITTSGPGLLNAFAAAGTAYCESRPLLILSPGAPNGSAGRRVGALHETKDPIGALGSIVEWSRRAGSAREAVDLVHDAFELFRHHRPRPVHIEVPLDILEAPHDCSAADFEPRMPRAGRSADPALVRAAATALAAAVSPVILAGGGSLRASAAIKELSERLQAAVVTTVNGKGVVPESHPLSVGSELRLPAARRLCDEADLLLVIGSKVGEAELWDVAPEPHGTVIRIDIDEDQLRINVAPDIALAGDSAVIVPQLLQALPTDLERPKRNLARLNQRLRGEARAIAPELVLINEQVAAVLPPDGVIVGDSSQVTYLGTTSVLASQVPHQLLSTPTFATLGYGLPAAIGAKIAAPERTVVCVLGDGALMFAIQEMITAVEQRVDLPIICIDNGGYGEIRQNMVDRGFAPVGVELVQPDWVLLASAFGATGFAITAVAELADVLRQALRTHGTSLIHLKTASGRAEGFSPAE